MRILSQEGTKDIPYERFCLGITGDGCIIATQNVCEPPSAIVKSVMAKYSTTEKAQKAMEMLHEEWRDYGECGMFYFPADDEIEV